MRAGDLLGNVIILLLRCCYTVITLLLHCCYTVVTLMLHCCCTFRLWHHLGPYGSRVSCLLSAACCLLSAVYCLLCAVCCLLSVVLCHLVQTAGTVRCWSYAGRAQRKSRCPTVQFGSSLTTGTRSVLPAVCSQLFAASLLYPFFCSLFYPLWCLVSYVCCLLSAVCQFLSAMGSLRFALCSLLCALCNFQLRLACSNPLVSICSPAPLCLILWSIVPLFLLRIHAILSLYQYLYLSSLR
jgi:hypothetical protein